MARPANCASIACTIDWIELKARKFQPGDGARLGMYMTAADRLLCHPDDKATLGLLLVREKNRVLVKYVLGGNTRPISVAEWDTRLTHALPKELQASLPTVEQIEAELARGPENAVAGAAPDTGAKRAHRATRRGRRAKS